MRTIHTPIALALLTFLSMGCSTDLNFSGEDANQRTFHVTQPDADGMVTVLADSGTLDSDSVVTLHNDDLGLRLDADSGEDGSLLAAFTAELGDNLFIEYTDPDGQPRTANASPDEESIRLHGMLMMEDVDGPEGEAPPCFILKVAPPPQDGQSQPPPPHGEDGETRTPPPEGGEGNQPPPTPGEGEQPTPGEGMATPPQDGEAGQHPPQGEGDGPPPAVLLVGPALGDPSELMALVGKPISVIGHPGDPNGERPEGEGPQGEGQQGEGQQGEGPNGEGAQGEPPCPLPPFVAEAIVPEQGAGGVEMRGTLEFTTVETTDESIDCYTFSRDDIQTEEGQPADFPDRLEFVGPKAKDFYSQDPTDGSQLMISGHPVQAPTRCGFPAFELTEVRVDGAEADNGE